MAHKAPAFCKHPSDRAACEASLEAVCGRGRLEEHCVTDGLRHGYEACETVVAEGFRQRENEMLLRACERVLLWGFRADVAAAKALFERTTRDLIRWAIRRRGVTDFHLMQDVYQDVYLALDKYFSKGGVPSRRLSSFVAAAAQNEAGRALPKRDRSAGSQHLWERHGPRGMRPAEPIPAGVSYDWRRFDRALQASRRRDLIDRIIFAQRWIMNWSVGKKLATKELLADWESLGGMTAEQLSARLDELTADLERVRDKDAPDFCSLMINSDRIGVPEIPLAFAACEGLSKSETQQLVDVLAEASVTFVDQRTFLLKRFLLGLRGE